MESTKLDRRYFWILECNNEDDREVYGTQENNDISNRNDFMIDQFNNKMEDLKYTKEQIEDDRSILVLNEFVSLTRVDTVEKTLEIYHEEDMNFDLIMDTLLEIESEEEED